MVKDGKNTLIATTKLIEQFKLEGTSGSSPDFCSMQGQL